MQQPRITIDTHFTEATINVGADRLSSGTIVLSFGDSHFYGTEDQIVDLLEEAIGAVRKAIRG